MKDKPRRLDPPGLELVLTSAPRITSPEVERLFGPFGLGIACCSRDAHCFRSAAGRSGVLTDKPMNRVDAWRMIQRRAAELGMLIKIGCHTFRATGITAYLEAGGTLENAQLMAAHESPRTTKLYDRTGDEITLDEVERISI